MRLSRSLPRRSFSPQRCSRPLQDRSLRLLALRLSALGRCFFIITFLSAGLVSCAGPGAIGSTPVLQHTPTPTGLEPLLETDLPSLTQTLPAATPLASPSPLRLRLWIPPQFDPDSGSPAAEILRQRLDEFTQQRPGVEIQVRIKALSGPGGLFDSLSTASAAAPLAMPDIVALPRELLEAAALKGLLRPMNNLTDALEDPDWYDYARQLSRLQDSIYGLPFAGDALVLVYRPEKIPSPPLDWAAALELRSALVFPAADPLALFSVAQYQASGGEIRDAEGRPFLDVAYLSSLLEFYLQAEQTELMPYWLTQFQSDDQVWQAFLEERSDMVVTWSSHYLSTVITTTNELPNLAFAPLPTPDGQPFTLASGWVWALASPNQGQRILGLELAEFLCDADFLARWTEALGYLPPRSNALDGWLDVAIQPLFGPVLRSAQLYPSTDISTPLGAALQDAVIRVLKEQNDPVTAAQAAADNLAGP